MKDLTMYRGLVDFTALYEYDEKIERLKNLAIPEQWEYRNPNSDGDQQPNKILRNYIHHTFGRLLDEHREAENDEEQQKIIYIKDDKDERKSLACFNTGLFTPKFNSIYALMYKNTRGNNPCPYFFYNFLDESENKLTDVLSLPRRANYFTNPSELIYDHNLPLRRDLDHILQDNRDRFPERVRDLPYLELLLDGAITRALKRVQANYKMAVPNYFDKEISLLLPICFEDNSPAELALAIRRCEGFYVAKTILTIDMAYNDARLIAKPDVDWLAP